MRDPVVEADLVFVSKTGLSVRWVGGGTIPVSREMDRKIPPCGVYGIRR